VSGTPAGAATVGTAADEAAELEQINALYGFLENRYMKRYPLSAKTLSPASNPAHYANLMREIEEAPQRSRFQAWVNSWKGWLRWK
jgi:cytochrome b pre-mRNA-processing protein 6